MKKRPLCFTAVLFLMVQAAFLGGFQVAEEREPSALERCAKDGCRVTLTGTVIQREEGSTYRQYYLANSEIDFGEQKNCFSAPQKPELWDTGRESLRKQAQVKGQAAEASAGQKQINRQIIKESRILVYIENKNTDTEKNKHAAVKISVGNRIRLTGILSFYEKERNPGNFNQKFYYQKKGIHARVWAEEAEVVENKTAFLRENLTHFRLFWKDRLNDAMGSHYGTIMSAILLGEKGGLEEEVKELYQKSGMGHILAISGLHMSFLGMGFYRLLRRSGFGFYPAGIGGMFFLLLYTLMTGGGVSGLRALIMFLIHMGAEMTGRTYDIPTSLALAALFLVQYEPLFLMDTGFLLSFGAILGIVLLHPLLKEFRVFPGILCAAVSVQLFLLPVLLYSYFEIPTYSLLLNLLFIPLMSGIMGFGVAGSILSVFWLHGGTLLFQGCRWILWLYEKGCMLTMKLPFGRIVLGQPSKWCIVGYYVILLAGCAAGYTWRRQKKEKPFPAKLYPVHCRRLLRMGTILLPIIFCMLTSLKYAKDGELQVTLLDVGQGDGLYIRLPDGKNCLIDGGSTDVSGVGKYRIEPYLKSQGVQRLDYVFLSHGDEDHINGIRELLQDQTLGVKVRTLVLPARQVLDEALWKLAGEALKYKTRVVTMERGQKFTAGEFTLSCLAPGKDDRGESGNVASMVLLLQYRCFRMLFTGDIEGRGEEKLVEGGALKDCDVLKVAHHGSKNSTSEEFLAQVKPEIALISAGRENRYGHPHEETLKRLRKNRTTGPGQQEKDTMCRIYNTQDCGAVTIRTDGKTVRVSTYL